MFFLNFSLVRSVTCFFLIKKIFLKVFWNAIMTIYQEEVMTWKLFKHGARCRHL